MTLFLGKSCSYNQDIPEDLDPFNKSLISHHPGAQHPLSDPGAYPRLGRTVSVV